MIKMMFVRLPVKLSILLAVFWSAVPAGDYLIADEPKPNIVFIMADDLGWQDVGFMGSRYFRNPSP